MEKIFIDSNNVDYSLVKKAAGVLSRGGLVSFPTETVYGLAVRADKKDAVDRLYEVKKRPKDKPFAFAFDSVDNVIGNCFDVLPPFGYRLMENFWPGPLTIIYYTPDNKKIGARVPSHIVASEILRQLNVAVYLPSANISGEKEAVSASEVEKVFDGRVDLIVDSGRSTYSKSSTVIDLTYKPFKVLREGVVPEAEIARIFVKKRIIFVCTGNSCRSPMAQFLLEKYLREIKPYFDDRYEIVSAGISAFPGSKAAPPVISILGEQEAIDSRNFSSRRLDRYMILSSDLIFTMEDVQNDYVLRFEPKAEGRVFNLKKFLPPEKEKDIPDPIGKSLGLYQEVYSLIKEAILELRDWL